MRKCCDNNCSPNPANGRALFGSNSDFGTVNVVVIRKRKRKSAEGGEKTDREWLLARRVATKSCRVRHSDDIATGRKSERISE